MMSRVLLCLLVVLITAGTGCSSSAGPGADSTVGDLPTHHAPGGGFRNPPGSPERKSTFGDMFRFIIGQIFGLTDPVIPDDHVLGQSEKDAQLVNATNTSITWLGHAAFIVRVDGKIILTDPFLGNTAGPFGIGPRRFIPSAMPVEALPRADVMIISHNHYDHLDATTINNYAFKEETQVIVPLGLGEFFVSRGYKKVLEQDWWQTWQRADLTIQTLPAVHFSGRGIGDRNDTLWASFSIQAGGTKIWFSGDTARGDIFTEVGERAGPFDYALIAIGAYEPRKIMQSVHVNPEEAVQLAATIRARHAIGMHWGTIMLTPENPFDAPKRFRQAAIDQEFGVENVSVMRIGETRDLGERQKE